MIPKAGNYFFLVPWIAFIPWYGMLIAMMICWAEQGHPIYWFMMEYQFPVYISDIGATNLQPLFISCVAWQGLGYVITIACEYFQRCGRWPFQRNKSDDSDINDESSSDSSIELKYAKLLLSGKFLMPPWYSIQERNLIFASFALGCIAELCLLMCSIFSTARHHIVHLTMLGLFCAFMFLSISCNAVEYFSMGRHYAQLHPLAHLPSEMNNNKWYQFSGYIWNKFIISAIFKVFWLICSLVWAICFGAVSDGSISASFEWLLAFWFGLIFMNISLDFYLGGRYKFSKYFHQVESFSGYYKYDQLVVLTQKDME